MHRVKILFFKYNKLKVIRVILFRILKKKQVESYPQEFEKDIFQTVFRSAFIDETKMCHSIYINNLLRMKFWNEKWRIKWYGKKNQI